MTPTFFVSPLEFHTWLEHNHDKESEIWVGFWKKASGKEGMSYAQAVDEALCFGWIDGLVNKYDELSYAQRFSPRRSKSVWSKINTQHIDRLTKEGRMMPSGLATVDAAKADGRWDRAYDSPVNAVVPKEFLAELKKNKKAETFFRTLNKSNLYSIVFALQNAKKEETKIRRIASIIQKLEREEKFH